MELSEAIMSLAADIPDDGLERLMLISRNHDGTPSMRLAHSVESIIAKLIKDEDIESGNQCILLIRKEDEGGIIVSLSNDIFEFFAQMIALTVDLSKRGDDLDPEMVRQSIKQLSSEITFVSERVKRLEE